MKRRKFIIIGCVIIIILIIVYYALNRQFIPPKPQDLSNVVITLERTACFGRCPVYSLTIFGNGRVEYYGEEYVEITGTQTAQITQDEVRELVDVFYRIKYFNLHDEYRFEFSIHGVWISVTDQPTEITSITINGFRKQVLDYYAAPEKLKDLEDKIDEIAGTERWIGSGIPQEDAGGGHEL
jgi:hypothetical protein